MITVAAIVYLYIAGALLCAVGSALSIRMGAVDFGPEERARVAVWLAVFVVGWPVVAPVEITRQWLRGAFDA